MKQSSRLFQGLSVCLLAAAFGVGSGYINPSSSYALAKQAESPTTSPSSSPSTSPSSKPSTPTPAELIKQLKANQDKEKDKPLVAHIDLAGAVGEREADFNFLAPSGEGLTLRSLMDRLEKAKSDKDVRGVLITLGAGTSMSLAQAAEARDMLKEIGKAGKRVFVYADSYDNTSYTLASGATDVCLLEGGDVFLPGVGIETQFYKGLFDKVGLKADYIQVGEYKGADESYTRVKASDELRGELTRLTESMYETMVSAISENRNLSQAVVRQIIDEAMISGQAAKDRGLVDHLVDMDGLRPMLEKQLNSDDLRLSSNYGASDRPKVDFNNLLGSIALMARPEPKATKPVVAVVFADGVIVDGEGGGGGGLLGGGPEVGSDSMRRAFRETLRDDNIKAVVLRIDSPGGSALASEAMWQSARRLAAEKPLIISIGSMAASGGYYIASAGDYIFADSTAIVGSIGVVGGKFVLGGVYEKLGVTNEAFGKGKNANLFSSAEPWTDSQRAMVTRWMKQTYDQFTQRIMTTRTGKITDIDQVARGRIFLARDAVKLGMVDEIGGFRKALAYAAKQSELGEGEFEVRVYPKPKTLADLFSGDGRQVRAPIQQMVGSASLLGALPDSVRRPLIMHLRTLQLLEHRPVILAMPYMITIK